MTAEFVVLGYVRRYDRVQNEQRETDERRDLQCCAVKSKLVLLKEDANDPDICLVQKHECKIRYQHRQGK